MQVNKWLSLLCVAALLQCGQAHAQRLDTLGPQVRPFLRVSTAKVILEHVRVIDGTGAAPLADQNVTIADGKIAAISAGADTPASDGVTVLDLRGYSVTPGIVNMHGPLYYLARPNLGPDLSFERPSLFLPMTFSAPRLYLANGITTVRTAGGVEPYGDLKLKKLIESGVLPGPHIDVTGTYLDGPNNGVPQMQELTGPQDARETVAYWADRGVTSFKAYANITRAELSAAVIEAHRHGVKVTGHLCAVTYDEAAEIGIDNLEHGFFVNTSLDSGKNPDVCSDSGGDETLERMPPDSAEAKRLFATLISHHVAITSTLTNLASAVKRPQLPAAAMQSMSPSMREALSYARNRAPGPTAAKSAFRLRREMDLERAFAAAGGFLITGSDANGLGGMVPGFGEHYQLEMLVEAGFTPLEAIRIATLNGAIYLGRADSIGSIAVGKNADLMVVKGDPASRIADIGNVEIVFKDGAGYDTGKLLQSVKGRYGEY